MLMKIGEFSKLSRVSVRMLRHYDEIGLLKPAETDPWTDYRYYRADQLPTMCRIAALKDIGFSLAEIAQMLTEDADRLEERFDRRQRQLEAEARDVAQKRMLLDAARNRLRKDETMSYHITLKTIPARYAATIQMTVPRYQDEGLLWAAMRKETAGLKMIETDPCLLGVTYLDGEYKESNVELLGWKTVKGQYPDTEHVKFRTLPEVRVASCTFRKSTGSMPPWAPGSRKTASRPPGRRSSTSTIWVIKTPRTRSNSSQRPAGPFGKSKENRSVLQDRAVFPGIMLLLRCFPGRSGGRFRCLSCRRRGWNKRRTRR